MLPSESVRAVLLGSAQPWRQPFWPDLSSDAVWFGPGDAAAFDAAMAIISAILWWF